MPKANFAKHFFQTKGEHESPLRLIFGVPLPAAVSSVSKRPKP
jgi:hypothetical protein